MSIKSKKTSKTLKTIEKTTGVKLTLGKLLWAIRLSDEISQSEFAEKLGISKQHLCDIEHDRKSISPKLAADYSKKLGYSTQQFIRLSLQDMLDRAGLDFLIDVNPKRGRKFQPLKWADVHS